jgi:hypothetical protein
MGLCYIRVQNVWTVLKRNVRAKRSIEYFIGFWLRILCISRDLFDADDLLTLRALAKTMTGAIHFVLWSEPTHVGQFWFFHAFSFPQAGTDCYGTAILYCRNQAISRFEGFRV